jgi:hypothetical protein
MVMDNDIRPVRGPQPPFSPRTNSSETNSSPESDPEQWVDEAKIEQEFGLPSNEGPKLTKRSRIMKLLPAFTLSRKKPGKKRLLIVGGIALLLVAVVGASSYLWLQHYKPSVTQAVLPKNKYQPPAKPTTVPSTLTGLMVDPTVNDRTVTGVMIENSIDARPQSGLDQAGVVFEAIAEGGITRFLALFQDSQPDYIGPVRSARPYYIQWLLGFDAAYAHVGGSPEALQDVTSQHVKDLNQFYNAGAYQRISSRLAPHNVYTSIAQLNGLESSKGFGKSSFSGFLRKAEAPSKAPNAASINIAFSGTYYNTRYAYDPATNSYKRSEGGAPHMEFHKDGSQVQIAPKVVLALVMPYSVEADGYHSSYQTLGTGQLFVFQDGNVGVGTWSKANNTAQFTFSDANGHPFPLNPGQTWIAAVGNASSVTYQ